MAKVLRSTYRYPTTESETQATNTRVFTAKFNLVYDPELGVIRPPNSLEEEQALGIRATTAYSLANYFLGLSVNDIVIHDGVFKILNGIVINFTNNGQEAVAVINTSLIDFGILDDIKIAVIKSNTYSPWLYYGSIPERAKLVYGDNRQIASSGAIYPIEDNDLIQAVGFRYFVDVNLDTLHVPIILPFVSAFFSPSFGISAAAETAFFVADAVDGDGGIGYRTSTNFKIFSFALTESIATVFETVTAQTIRTDAFRTLNYRQLEYKKNTNKINKIIENYDYYIIADPEVQISNYINLIGNSFDSIGKFINFEKTRMSLNSSSITSDEATIKQQFEDFSESPGNGVSGYITTAQLVIGNDISNNPSENTTLPIVISDLITEIDDENAQESLRRAVSDFTSQLPNTTLKLQLFITDTSRSTQTIALANEIFGTDNVIQIDATNALNLGWLSFIGLLTEVSEIIFDENSLVKEQISVDVNSIKEGFEIAVSETGSTGTDYDKDGIISIIDSRLYELTTKYRPTQNLVSLDTFLSDPGSEMRFWRKIISIGDLFNFAGKIISSNVVVGGNLLLKVDIEWPQIEDPENPGNFIDDPEKPETNIINVLVEYGAKTNLESIDSSQNVLFQGKLFYPGYIIKTRLNSIIGFGANQPISISDLSEISSWFRVFLSTARTILDFGSNEETKNEPLLIIRSNTAPTNSQSANTSATGLSPIFGQGGSAPGPQSQYRLIEGSEEVDDFLNLLDDNRNLVDQTSIDFNEKLEIFTPGSDVVFSSIEFEILIPKDSVAPAIGNTGEDGKIAEFEYEILYQPSGFDTDDSILTKFFSVEAFNGEVVGEKLVYKIKYNPQNNQKFVCQPTQQDKDLPDTTFGIDGAAIPNPEKNREFNVTFPYGQKNDGTDFVWTWNEADWEFSITKNSTTLTTSDYEVVPDPTTGKFKLNTSINPQNDILTAEFINISGNQRKLKKGSKISLRLKSGPQEIEKPTFRNSRINFETFNRAERVEAHYSSTLQGDSYYLINPTQGFVSLSGAGWTFNQESGTERSGGVFGTRVVGNVNGPILFIDAFGKETADKVISKVGGIESSFPYIDVVHSNLVNSFGKPFLETLSILFEPPLPPDVERIALVRSPITDKLSLFYNSGDILQQKYSFTNFNDRNTDDNWDEFVDRSLRRNIPVYSEFITFVDKDFEYSPDGGSVIFDVTNTDTTGVEAGDKILVQIGLESRVPNVEILPMSTVKVYELFASVDGTEFVPFGYINALGENISLRIAYDKNLLVQLPDTRGINKIKIKTTDNSPIDIYKISAGYVNSIVPGKSPAIFETSYGEYFLFFMQPVTGSPLRQIKALFSNHDAQEWVRPGVSTYIEVTTVDENVSTTVRQRNPDLENPIIILSGYNNPVVVKSNISDTFYLFLYNARTVPGKIDMVEMERALFLKIEENNDENATDIAAEAPDESQTSLVETAEIKSYARVFKPTDSGGFNHVKTVLTNASQNFSTVLTNSGDMYLAVITSDGQFRIKYNRSLGGGNINTSFNWEDLGINLFDTTTDNDDGTVGSFLSKVVSPTNIGALTLSFSEKDDILHLYISTVSDRRLIAISLSEYIIKPKGLRTVSNDGQTHSFLGEEKTDLEIDQYFQIQVNLTKPILVAGKKEGLNANFIETRSGTTDTFPPQIVYCEWLASGIGQLYYVASNGRIKGRVTLTSGLFWEDFNSI